MSSNHIAISLKINAPIQKVWDGVTKAEYGLQFILKDDVIVFVNNILISSFKMLLS